MMSSFSLTNGKAYIRFKVWDLVQIQPIGNEEFVSAPDATFGGMMVSLVQAASVLFVPNLQNGRTRQAAPKFDRGIAQSCVNGDCNK
jgi:hypothetical protein